MGSWWQNIFGGAAENTAEYPEWFRDFLEAQPRLPGSTPISEISFTVYDTETTGLDPRKDLLLSIGALSVRDGIIQTAGAFGCYLNPMLAKQKTTAIPIHGLVPDSESRTYLDETTAVRSFLEWMPAPTVLVAHHLAFDRYMIDEALAREKAGKLPQAGVDTFFLAQKLQPRSYWQPDDAFSLDHLARQYRIPLSDRHTALGDSYITAVLLLKLLNRLEDRKGRPLLLEDITGKP